MIAQSGERYKAAMARALARAQAEGTQALYHVGQWYASSTSRQGHWHKVHPQAGSCECQAGRRGLPCKHLAAVGQSRPVGIDGNIMEWARTRLSRAERSSRCRRDCRVGKLWSRGP